MILVVPFVVQAVIAKRHIADGNIERVVCKLGILVTGDFNVSIRVQLAGNTSADAVQLHAGELTVLHALRQHTEEVADTHRRLQNSAVFKAELSRSVIDRADDRGRGIVRVQNRRACGLVFVLSEQTAQLLVAAVIGTERACHAAPADILREHLLFLGSRRTVCGFQTFQQADSRKVSVKFFSKRAGAEVVIGNMESGRIAAQRIAVFLKRGFFCLLHRGKLCPLAVDHNGYRLCAIRLSSFLRVRLEHIGCRIAFVLRHQPRKAFSAFRPENRIRLRRVAELYIEFANLGDFKRPAIQINGIACMVVLCVPMEHIGGFGCGHILRVRLEHILRFRRTSCCFTQHRHNIIVSRILTKEIQQAAVTVTNILTLGECSAVRQQQRKFGFIVTGILVCFFISGIESIFQRTILFLDGFPTGNKILIRFSH